MSFGCATAACRCRGVVDALTDCRLMPFGVRCGAVATAPFPLTMQQKPLYIARGDITAGETKAVKEATSVTGRLQVRLSSCAAGFPFLIVWGPGVRGREGTEMAGGVQGDYAQRPQPAAGGTRFASMRACLRVFH